MKKLLSRVLLITALLAMAWQVEAQGSLSNQVLRLLTRANMWSAVQTFSHTVGVTLEQGAAPTITTDSLYNIGGNLYFNGTLVATSAGAGTVTSVALTVPNILSVSGSPVTSSGTLAVTLATQTANKVFASATSGGAATPAFRALTAADIPDISATYVTPAGAAAFTNKTGNISQWTNNSGYITNSQTTLSSLVSIGTITTGTWNGTVVAGLYGGTGVANSGKTITLGGNINIAANLTTSGANNLTFTTSGSTNVTLPTSGTLLTSTATTLSSLASIGTITTGVWNGTVIGAAYGGTGLATYAVGDVLYASGTTALSKLADVATGNALISGGVTTAPSWGKIGLTTHVSGTLPLANGGTGVTTAADDTVLVGSGAAWVAKTLTSGVQSYDTATNTFSVPTTFILGTGAPTASTSNILLRSNITGTLEVMLGNQSAYGAVKALLYTGGVFASTTTDEGNSGTAKTIDLSTTNVHKVTLTGNVTFTLSNPADGAEYILELYTGAGSFTVTWPAAVKWPAASTPTITATASRVDVVRLIYNSGSSDYFGSIVQVYTP